MKSMELSIAFNMDKWILGIIVAYCFQTVIVLAMIYFVNTP